MSAIDGNEMDGHEALVSELRANPPVAPERLRQRVLEGAPAARAPRSRRRKLVLVVAPLAVVLAVGAALVHGFVNSGSKRAALLAPDARIPGSLAQSQSGAANTTPEAAVAHSAAVPQSKQLSTASKTYSLDQGFRSASGSTLSSLSGVAHNSVVIPRHRLVHATASLQVGVKRSDLSAKTNEASQIVGSFGGYAQSVRYQATHQGDGEALLSLRVPVQNANAAIAKLGNLGTLLSQQVSTQDLQAKVTHQTSAIGSLRRAIAVYEAALRSPSLSATDRASLQIKLNNARRAQARLRHARTSTLASAATAGISLLLTTNNHAVVPVHHGSTRIGRLLGSAARFLALEGIIVLYALIVLAPVLLIGGLVWWALRERRRREERLLASA